MTGLYLQHYTSPVIQAMDLIFLVPAAVISGISIIKKKPLGYLLSCVLIFKFASLFTVILAMMLIQHVSGVEQSMFTGVIFSIIGLFVYAVLAVLLKNIEE